MTDQKRFTALASDAVLDAEWELCSFSGPGIGRAWHGSSPVSAVSRRRTHDERHPGLDLVGPCGPLGRGDGCDVGWG